MGDISIKGRSPLLKGGRVGFDQGLKVKQIDPLAARLTEAGHMGGAGKSLIKKGTRPTKDTGLHKGSTRSDTSSIGMGKLKTPTKQDYILKNQLKKVQKMPDKKFKSQNPATEKVKSDRTGKVHEVRKKDLVKGSLGKKTYKQDMKYYHHWRHPKGE